MKKNSKDQLFMIFYFFRIILAVVVMLTLFRPWKTLTLLLFFITIIIGFIDVVRFRLDFHYKQVDSILNALADKLLINLSAVALYLQGQLPWWAMAVFLAKDILLIAGGLYTLYRNEFTIFKPTLISKLTLFFQVVSIIAIVMEKADHILLVTAVLFTAANLIFAYLRPEIRILRKKERLQQRFALKKLLKPADFITLLNVIFGLLSIIAATIGLLDIAAVILLAAVAADFFDGKVARWTKTAGEFGKNLDSLADTVSFGVAPTIIGFSLVQSKLAVLAFSIFLAAGILRLAKFNIMNLEGAYIGMPVTWNGIIIPLAFIVGLPALYYPYLYLLLSILMVAPVQVTKRK